MYDDDSFPIVICQQPVTYDGELVNRLIYSVDDLPSGIAFTVIATKVQTD